MVNIPSIAVAATRLRTGVVRREPGFSLIEMLIALGVMGIIGVGFSLALQGALRAQDLTKERVTSENLVRAQLEEIRNQGFLASYTSTVPWPSGYSISITTEDYCVGVACIPDGNLQKNTVRVIRGTQTLVTVGDLKSKR